MVISNPRRHEAVGQIQDPLENLGKWSFKWHMALIPSSLGVLTIQIAKLYILTNICIAYLLLIIDFTVKVWLFFPLNGNMNCNTGAPQDHCSKEI